MTADEYGGPDELELARGALRIVEKYGNLSDDDLLMVMASGAGPGARQRQYLMHAGALALVSIADSLERIVELLEPIADRLTYPDGRPPA